MTDATAPPTGAAISTATPTLSAAFAAAARQNRAALIPYLMLGFPNRHDCVELAVAAAEAGADVVELGLPFSDPLADGPVIQAAGTQALAGGTTLLDCLEAAAAIRSRTSVPLVFMGYANNVLRHGAARFCRDAAAAGVSGLIVPDLPVDEADELRAHARQERIDVVFLVAPNTGDERIATVAAASSGFVYCVSLTGVTGVRADVGADTAALLQRVRRHTGLPVAVGFGISTPGHVRTVARLADGVIVGSALIRLIGDTAPAARVDTARRFIAELLAATAR